MMTFQAEYYRLDKKGKRVLALNILAIQFLIASAVFVFSLLLKNQILVYLNLDYRWILAALLLSLSGSFFDLQSHILRLEEKPRSFSFLQILNSVLNAVLAILFVVVLKAGWEGRLYAAILAAITMFCISAFFLYKHKWLSEKFSKKVAKEQFLLGIPLLPQAITPFLRKGLDKIVLTGSYGLGSNGLFSFAMNFGSILSMVTDALFSVITPNLYKFLANITPDFREHQLRKLTRVTIVGILIFILILTASYFVFYVVITFLFKKQYHGAVYFIPFILAEVFFQALSRYFSSFIIYQRKTTAFGSMIFFVAILHALLSIFLIPALGIKGAMISLLVSEFMKFGLTFYLSNKFFPLKWFSLKTN